MDLGQTKTLLHDIELQNQGPIYDKQFKILDVHLQEVEQNFAEWLKLGVVQTRQSKHKIPVLGHEEKLRAMTGAGFLGTQRQVHGRQVLHEGRP